MEGIDVTTIRRAAGYLYHLAAAEWGRLGTRRWMALLLAAACLAAHSGAAEPLAGDPLPYRAPRRIAELVNAEIRESSGLAASVRTPDLFWTHNDSGDTARIFAFDRTGASRGECRFSGVEAVDWEDMASFRWRGGAWLVLADVGDNGRRRKDCMLLFCEEPTAGQGHAKPLQLAFRYEDGPRDCEAVGVDAERGTILLATKSWGTECGIYQLNLPTESLLNGAVPPSQTARRIATITIPIATAMDISADGQYAIIGTYTDGFLFARSASESWEQALARPLQRVSFPLRRQGESVCFGADSRTLYLTSESAPTPLWEIGWGTPASTER